MDRSAAFAAFSRSALKLGSGSVLPPYRKRLKMLPIPISQWGPMAMGDGDESVIGIKNLTDDFVGC
eukprot:scaffold12100_cov32-Cyclotella_meneghiniana.AAC.4